MTKPSISCVEPDIYMPLRQALRLLYDIRPMLARDELGRARFEARRAQDNTARVAAITVTLQELEELFILDARGLPRVSPAGAALLLRLHAADVFERRDHASGRSAPVELVRYADSLQALLQRQTEIHASRRTVEDMIEHSERAYPQHFSYNLLKGIFGHERDPSS